MADRSNRTERDVLVVNAGSSTLKVARRPAGHSVMVDRLGADGGGIDATVDGALRSCLDRLAAERPLDAVTVVAHRVVHGGERFDRATILDDDAMAALEEFVALAPLHMPANLAGVRAARRALPHVPHVAVFDTAFHAGMPPHASRYAVPASWYERYGIRRYGFHGPSHDGLSRRTAELLGRPLEEVRIVTLHLGNGASAAAVDRGRSIDTSMGFTPLEGLVMGTRPGSLDPGALLHLLRAGMPLDELEHDLQHRSGLLGLSGRSNDVRDLRTAAAAGDAAAAAALTAFAYRVRITVGAYAFALGGLDAVAFTGGIGQHDPAMRTEALAGLERFGIEIDEAANRAGGPRIDADDANVAVVVLATDEEAVMADAASALVAGGETT